MSEEFNNFTRIHDDPCEFNHQQALNVDSFKYTTYNPEYLHDPCDSRRLQGFCKSYEPLAHIIDDESALRQNYDRNTNPRNIHQLNPAELLTTGYKGTGDLIGGMSTMTREMKNIVDVESMHLRPELSRFKSRACCWNGSDFEEHQYEYLDCDPQQFVTPDFVTWGGESTRNIHRDLFVSTCGNLKQHYQTTGPTSFDYVHPRAANNGVASGATTNPQVSVDRGFNPPNDYTYGGNYVAQA